ncbi:4-(cytidine 5'-diphospho)-2-C-methyl-D-erythritol kinase [Marihabitans asiaticum]|uniref:4-diphosphocytidyl-2-C-methyl-D-erythritol kinase n=1 Tax=Marihabitans asiaticum TaxID=415218 RepID=A0A560WDD6_9MICO|nr:4-(cytidine 5'-diphospho)-2-C-methyl-D-erythritol kinase [Marihabitans asiaticum]TWD15622.1 4-diphosphocytidyl-2-C-methyl-D-erythritol kinase [Marihabitans asiaticum]
MTSVLETTAAVTARAPAKVNLELGVGPLRDDGYHTLSTVYQAVGVHDDVTAAIADEWGVSVRGRDAELVPTDESNLALRAARLLAERAGDVEPVHLTIHKGIPVAGGMAGGSADAAAALIACDALWGSGLGKDELEPLAAQLGADVPFLLHGGTAVGSGRGELISPVLARGTYHWVFVPTDSEGLSTPQVYRTFDELNAAREIDEPRPSPDMMAALRNGDAEALAAVLSNDLQPAAILLQPRIDEIIESAMGFGALAAIVSGSGPTVALLADGQEGAIDLSVALAASRTAEDILRASGPVAGAHVIPAPRLT